LFFFLDWVSLFNIEFNSQLRMKHKGFYWNPYPDSQQ
jgi:hypothetical protein